MQAALLSHHPVPSGISPIQANRAWQAILARDASFDNRIFFAVTTTGIFCRPSCTSRRPLRKNVEFHPTAASALRQGFRPCLRCHPTTASSAQKQNSLIELCLYIQANAHHPLTLPHLAHRIGMTPAKLRSCFKSTFHLTLLQFINACRAAHFRTKLRTASSITSAIYASGYPTPARVYEKSPARLGMPLSTYRKGGTHTEISYTTFHSPLGHILLAATDKGLCTIQLADTPAKLLQRLKSEFPAATLHPMTQDRQPLFNVWSKLLLSHLATSGKTTLTTLPLDIQGTLFQEKVWRYLQKIPPGETRTYSQVANAIGSPRAIRAVASACAANRLALAIPCHRVIRGDGQPSGFRWDPKRKQALLIAESQTS